MPFRQTYSYLVQLIACVIMIYYGIFKKEIDPRDVVQMLFWCTLYIIEEVRQLSWKIEGTEKKEIE